MKILLLCCVWFAAAQPTERIIALRVQFQTDDSPFTTGDGRFDLRSVSDTDSIASILIDPPPHNRSYFQDHLTFAQNYYRTTTGRNIDFTVYPTVENSAYTVSKRMFDYYRNDPNDTINGLVRLYTEAVELAEADNVPFQPGDIVIIFHAGVGNDIARPFNETPNDIPSISLTRTIIDAVVPGWLSGNRSHRGIILPETMNQYGIPLAMNGMVVAQIGTQLGFVDLYDPVRNLSMTGPWSLEDRGLFNAAGLLPSIPSAVNRYLSQNPKDVIRTLNPDATDRQLDVRSLQSTDSSAVSIWRIRANADESFLVEVRSRPVYQTDIKLGLDQLIDELTPVGQRFLNYKQVLTHPDFSHRNDFTFSPRGVLINAVHFDAAIPHPGILIWHIDERVIQEKKESRLINTDPVLRGAWLLEADGVNNYQTGGDGFNDERFDVFYQGNAASYYTGIVDASTPTNTRSNYDQAETGLVFSGFSHPGSEMRFRVRRAFGAWISQKGRIINGENNLIYTQRNDTIFKHQVSETILSTVYSINRPDSIIFCMDSLLIAQTANELRFYRSTSGQLLRTQSWTLPIDTLFRRGFADIGLLAGASLWLSVLQGPFNQWVTGPILQITENADYYRTASGWSSTLTGDVVSVTGQPVTLGREIFGASIRNGVIRLNYLSGDPVHQFPATLTYRTLAPRNIQFQTLSDGPRHYLFTRDANAIVRIGNWNPKTEKPATYYNGQSLSSVHRSGDQIILLADSSFMVQPLQLPTYWNPIETPVPVSGLSDRETYIWPNPNQDETMNVRVRIGQPGNVTIRIFNDTGRFIRTLKRTVGFSDPVDIPLPVNELKNGTYIIQIEHGGRQLIRKAVVIR